MNFSFHPEAATELDQAAAYYEDQQSGLGLEFAEEVYSGIARINQFPDAWTKMSKNTSRALLNRFPYGIIFQITAGRLRIIAVANLHRRPGYWRNRV